MGAIGGHHSRVPQSNVWLTPPEILSALGTFDLDPCACTDRPWDTAREHYVEADDGLSRMWFGRVWLNPPYGDAVAAWMERMAQHNQGTALVFARTETVWFFVSVWKHAAAMLFLEGRLNFHLPDGKRSRMNAGGPSVLIAYGCDDADRLAESGLAGAFVPLAAAGQVIAVYRPTISWAALLREIVARQGGCLALGAAYVLVRHHPKAAANQNWQAKVRQILQGPAFERIGPGTYKLREA